MNKAKNPRNPRRMFSLLIIGIVVVAAGYLIARFVPERPVDYEAIEDHFKYGSIGSEPVNGLPYWIWKVLPEMFPEKLPGKGGYASFGFIYEQGRDLPIGVSQRRVTGIERVWLNCAVCHTSTLRETKGAEPQVILGMPANDFRLYLFIQFLREVALDNRLTSENVMAKIEEMGGNLDPIEKVAYRYFVVDRVRAALFELRQQLNFLDRQHPWGPGRVDTFNPYKAIQFNFPMDTLPAEELIGPADYPSIWDQRPREGMYLHWDGNNPSVQERNKSAALGAGVTPVTIDLERIGRIEDWLWDFKPLAYPKEITSAKAAEGKQLYGQYCAQCHGMQEGDQYLFDTGRFSRLGKVEPITAIGTDPGRLNSYTELLSVNQNTLYVGYPWRFKHFRKTHGYANMPLDGLWLRAPYLHNGSVPTLRDLLEPAENRPKVFYRGYNVYDWEKVGFISDVAEEDGHEFFKFDTQVRGNSNAGHEGEAYGTSLSGAQKDAMVEYMKTF
ncbi:c-type cytochrome [Nitrosococcus watsonii]|uniref:c-type cytochrome n=1 Tax=Nitrosococcus watsonii TaxID=473531 RepID=UPI001E360905|nr:cytochrome c [Nitrosococcus watsonii]